MASRIYFTSIGPDGKYNLWVSDGTPAGTVRVLAANVGVSGLAAVHFATLNGQPYFEGFDAAGRASLFTVSAATGLVTAVNTPAGSAGGIAPGSMVAFNGRLFFQGRDVNGEYGLFVSDGTGAGTQRLAVPGTSGSFHAGSFTRFGTRLAFAGGAGVIDNALYLTDGTAAGTTRVVVNGATALGPNIRTMAAAGGRLVFTAADAAGRVVLWTSDGTTAGTAPLATAVNPTGGYSTAAAGLMSFGSRVAFTGSDAAGRIGVWVSDGTAPGTVELAGVTATAYGAPMVALPGNRFAFIGTSTVTGVTSVYVSDGAGVTLVQPAGASGSGLSPNAVMVLAGRLLFDGALASGGRGLFSSDGTSAGTALLQIGVTLVPGSIDTDSATVGPAPAIIAAPVQTTGADGIAVLGTATPGTAGDPLAITLLSDTAFATGSSLGLDAANRVIYTAGATPVARAGANAVGYRITDTLTGQTTDATAQVTLAPSVLGISNARTGQTAALALEAAGAGGPSYLLAQYIYAGSDDVALSTQAANVFLHGGSGNDAIQVSSGQNVLDGGLGSNFVTGGTGTDTFFTDARAPGVVWNTFRNFHAGDAATLWGFAAGTSSYRWEPAMAGAAGFEGATLRANIVGGAGRSGDGIDASITFAGLGVEQARGLQLVTGSVAAGSYLYIYNPGV